MSTEGFNLTCTVTLYIMVQMENGKSKRLKVSTVLYSPYFHNIDAEVERVKDFAHNQKAEFMKNNISIGEHMLIAVISIRSEEWR